MIFSGKVGDTFRLKNRYKYSEYWVILSIPDINGEVVVGMIVNQIKQQQIYVSLDQKDGKLFRGTKTVRFSDLNFMSQKIIIRYAQKNPDMCGDFCYPDTIKKIISGAFLAQQSPPRVMAFLQEQYPNIYNNSPV